MTFAKRHSRVRQDQAGAARRRLRAEELQAGPQYRAFRTARAADGGERGPALPQWWSAVGRCANVPPVRAAVKGDGRGTVAAFAAITTLFIAWGFISANNDPLIAALREI